MRIETPVEQGTAPVATETFAANMAALDISKTEPLAVAVSGGADSMALAFLLHRWGAENLHILSVDHGLRPESAAEAEMVKKFAHSIGVKSKIFKWIGKKPEKSIQEAARRARYDMMAHYCKEHGIRYLFLAHHADDQTETFLFRLASGSGPQGLTCMKPLQPYDDNLTLVRPLLLVPHNDLIETCKAANIRWAEDPSNQNEAYMRGRMRGAKEVLEREGLTADRISVLVGRLEVQQSYIAQQIEKEEKNTLLKKETKRIECRLSRIRETHELVVTDIIRRAIEQLQPHKDFPARLRDIERLATRIKSDPDFNGATLGGVKVSVSRKKDLLSFEPEAA